MPSTRLITGHRYRLPNGRTFIAVLINEQYVLCTLAEWRSRTPGSYVVWTDGRIALYGLDTGWRISDLRDTGPVERK